MVSFWLFAGAQPWYRYWGGPNVSPPQDIFFKVSRGSDRKNKQASPSTNVYRLINGVGSVGTPWSVTPAVIQPIFRVSC